MRLDDTLLALGARFWPQTDYFLERRGTLWSIVLLRKEVPVQPREKFQIVIIPLLVYVPLRKSNFVSVVLIRRIRYDTALDTGTCKSSLVVAKSEKTSLIDRGILSKNRRFLKTRKGSRSPFLPRRIGTRHRYQAMQYRFSTVPEIKGLYEQRRTLPEKKALQKCKP